MDTVQINPHEIYHRAKGQWLKTDAPKRDMQDLFFDLRILLLTLAFLAMGLLSSSHTVEAFSHNVPLGLAVVAPFAFELYLIASTLTSRSQRDLGTLLTQVLIFVVAVIANGASGWQRATVTSESNMVWVYQIMSLGAAAIVPMATMSIGHQLAVSIQTRQKADKVGDAWMLAEFGVFYKALYTAYNVQGVQPKEAKKLAQADAQGYLATGVKITNEQPRLPAQAGAVTDNPRPVADTGSVADTADNSGLTGQPRLRKGEAKQRFEALIQSDPAYLDNPLLSVDTLADRLGVGRSTAGELWKQWKETRVQESVV